MIDRNIIKDLALSEDEITTLDELDFSLQYYADLLAADMFINCFVPGKKESIVVAQAKPIGKISYYERTVIGDKALPENEPALFSARELGAPVWDTIAITQEQRTVRQDVVPIKREDGLVYAALICERDVSTDIRQEQKYKALAEQYESASKTYAEKVQNDYRISMKELNHRVKNNLQMIASILSIQKRRCGSEEAKSALEEAVDRILAMADTYDLLVRNGDTDHVSLWEILVNVRNAVQKSICSPEKNIVIDIDCDDIKIDTNRAIMAGLVVNELLTNSVKHAFSGRTEGHVNVTARKSNSSAAIRVSDDGTGFDISRIHESVGGRRSFGFELIEIVVKEKLKGNLRVVSDSSGTNAVFDVSIND